VVCRTCGRQILAPGVPRGGGLNRFAAKLVLLSVGLGVLVTIAAFVLAKLQPRSPGLSPLEREQALVRIVRENHSFDDSARQVLLKGALDERGQRCDSVTLALMTAPGRWSVECTPGRRYRVAFDEAGKAVSATRVR
jgi:hypothetical protein